MSAIFPPSSPLKVTEWHIDTSKEPTVAVVHLAGSGFITVSDPADARAFVADLTEATEALEAARQLAGAA